ncbi:OmpA family protein [Litoribrevibacter euphylliae]|uniref:OmpA family protein n=1 Tax=Litoribrevibacter euphylliae TaxID=1834034 RepID=A0ABV7HKH6_9GAMM
MKRSHFLQFAQFSQPSHFSRLSRLLLISSITCTSTQALAEEPGTFYINPAVGYQMFDSERNHDDTITAILGGEYVLTRDWGVEATYMMSSPDGDDGNEDADLDQVRLGALYYLPESGNWKPFLGAAIGEAQFEYDNSDHVETQLQLGGGARYSFNDDWSARLEARAINSLDEEDWDALVSIGLSYAFGGSAPKKSEPLMAEPMAAEPMKTEPAPKETMAVAPMVVDSDNDGVSDEMDKCPTTPAGAPVDGKGCPLDTDNDGVPDYKDQCPTTASGVQVDEKGCRIPLQQTVSINLAINFANNSAEVPQSSYGEIKRVADFMKKHSTTKVTIEGHTDDRGSAAYNKSLSQRRANSVMAILTGTYGVESNRVNAVGYGEEQPIADNSTAAGRTENRRVVAEIKETIVN